jgi:hypothetical protein
MSPTTCADDSEAPSRGYSEWSVDLKRGDYFLQADLSLRVTRSSVVPHRQCGCRLVSKQPAVASVVFVDVQTTLLDNLGSSSQCCRDGRIANVW